MPRTPSAATAATVVSALSALALAVLVACSNGDDSTGGTSGGGSSSTADGGTGAEGGTGIATGAGSLSCNDTADFLCVTFAQVPAGADTQYCDMESGTQVEACPSTEVIATCTFTSGGTDQEYFWYQGNAASTKNLSDVCGTLSGTFTSF